MPCKDIAIIINILCYTTHSLILREVTGSLRGGVSGEETGKHAPHAIDSCHIICYLASSLSGKLTEYGFKPVLTAIAEAPEGGLKDGEMPVPVTEVTRELLRSGRAYFYSHSAYEVTENIEGKSLLITLTDPNGNNYRHESSWLYSPDYMAEDIWYISLADSGLTSILNAEDYPAGVYQMAFYVDGLLADEFSFELK